MSSWRTVNNEENWLPWQIQKTDLIKKIKSLQKVLSPWDLQHFKSPVPKGLKYKLNNRVTNFHPTLGKNKFEKL